jgi:3-deoxy-manno-octulosonate cytidylyltransferase (CMP-KDO synthetase)
MKVLCVIPARMGASRYPGKPMELILGMPMVGHVYKRAILSKLVTDTYVATCDQVIFDYVKSIGGKAVMTSDKHKRCTERASEALVKVEEKEKTKYDVVLIVQGDEPMVTPTMIDASLIGMKENPTADVINLASKIETKEDVLDPNTIKVVFDKNWNALYFSRSPVPYLRENAKHTWFKQVCIMPFKRDFLLEFDQLPETSLEVIESIDMQRILEHGKEVKLVECNEKTQAVDTPSDLKRVEAFLRSDKYLPSYMKI